MPRALEDARAANRLLWIQFTGPWCPNCTRMESESFPDPTIIAHARRSFVPVKLRSDLNEQLVVACQITGIPASVVVAPNRDVIAIRQGFLGPDELDLFLRESLARCPLKPAADESATARDRKVPAPETAGTRAPEGPSENEPGTETLPALGGFCA